MPTPKAVYVIQNTGFPRDRRILRQAIEARDLGHRVTVIAPAIGGGAPRESFRGLRVRRYRLREAQEGTVAFLREFLGSFLRSGALTLREGLRPGTTFVQVGNPPDTLFPVLWILRLAGRRIIFDQHELTPELYLARFRAPNPLLMRALLRCERETYRVAHLVVATNESYAGMARGRGGKAAEDVMVVRNGPERREIVAPDPHAVPLAPGTPLLTYVGVIGPQDGVETVVDTLAELHRAGRTDVHAAIIGDGSALPAVAQRAEDLGVADFVHLPGWVSDQPTLRAWLLASWVCVAPEPSDPFNDRSTFIKVMEYMAAGKPVAAFDLAETRVSAGDAARYAPAGDVPALAREIGALLDSPQECAVRGAIGERRVEQQLGWWRIAPLYRAALQGLTGVGPVPAPVAMPAPVFAARPAMVAELEPAR